jgi:hypothetical protein
VSAIFKQQRDLYHRNLAGEVLGYRKDGSITNADSKSDTSRAIAEQLAQIIAQRLQLKLKTLLDQKGYNISGQELGHRFAEITRDFLEQSFLQLEHARPGPWTFSTSQAHVGIAGYEPYTHLARVQQFIEQLRKEAPDAAAFFEEDYLVKPDIIISRTPWPDKDINRNQYLVDANIAAYSPFRRRRQDQANLLHASVSCKWTLRSDRAQNARTEALNLLRSRKGRAPHIVVVTGEPMPSRIASLALGTGDIDCVYHFALPELRAAIHNLRNEGQREILEQLVQGNRLRDISDLPLDLAI